MPDYQRLTGVQPNAAARPWNNVVFTVGTEASNQISTNIQVRMNDNDLREVCHVDGWLSSQADGTDLSSAPSGGMGNGGGQHGHFIVEDVANRSFQGVTDAMGRIGVSMTHTGAGTFYIAVKLPNGRVQVSPAITFSA